MYQIDKNHHQSGDIAYIPAHGTTPAKYLQLATAQEISDYEQAVRDYEASGGTLPETPVHDGSAADKPKLVGEKEMLDEISLDLARTNLGQNSDIADSVSVGWSKGPGKTDFHLHFFGPLEVTLQVGADEGQELIFTINSLNAAILGINDVNVRGSDGTGASAGIEKVKAAIAKTSTERANLGSVQNRLDHIIKNLDNVVENTTAAESRLRDTDMTSEMQHYSNISVIAQAGQMVLAQANQSKQGVITLLQ